MNEKRLSVIIPGYNTPKAWWSRCLESVFRNLNNHDEVICVDDASTSDTSFLDEWARNDERLKIVRLPENRGQAFARNRGMELACGEYLAFVDSDDEVLPAVYDESIAQLKLTGADLSVYGIRTIWVENGLFADKVAAQDLDGPLTLAQLRMLGLERLFNFPWNKVFRRSFLVENGLDFHVKTSPREDEIFVAECVLKGARWCSIGRVGHIYYHTYGSSLSRYRRNEDESNRAVNDVWRRVWAMYGCADERLNIMNERQLLEAEWKNLWRMGSPLSLAARWRWLGEKGVQFRTFRFLKMVAYRVFRRWCYVRPLRRWLVRRLYPEVRNFQMSDIGGDAVR